MTSQSNQKDLTLVLGGTGKTGRRVADRLKAQGKNVRIGSRSATPSWSESGGISIERLLGRSDE